MRCLFVLMNDKALTLSSIRPIFGRIFFFFFFKKFYSHFSFYAGEISMETFFFLERGHSKNYVTLFFFFFANF